MNQPNPTQTFDRILAHVAEETFGELAFMLVTPDEFQTTEPPDRWGYVAMVDFNGPFGGQLYVAITENMLEPLADNMLGLEVGETPPEGVEPLDALKELLNVICGNLLPAIAGDEVVFQIGGPVLLDVATLPDSAPGRRIVAQACMELDCGHAAAVFLVDEEAQLPEPNL